MTNSYLARYLIIYIHRNPQLHSFVEDFRDWPWSSYGVVQKQVGTQDWQSLNYQVGVIF